MFDFPLDHFVYGIPAIMLAVAGAMTCQFLVKRLLGAETIKQCHEVGGYYLSIVGALYAVLLGLVVFDALGKFQDAEKTVELEGKSALAVSAIAKQFPKSDARIQTLVKRYLDQVIDVEWQMMARNGASMEARQALVDLVREILVIEPQTENQKALFPTLSAETMTLWEKRRDRVKLSNYGLPTPEWVVLLGGAAITIVFTFFFTIDSGPIHLFMTGLVTLIISMSLYLALLFGAPFSGDLRVSKDGLIATRKSCGQLSQRVNVAKTPRPS
ncbi:MAG: hypothetical protein ACR652_16210 [Methylocystis sp.]|uniref:bestrophin-like domain n=1 Tax=Methylocystis sp. TaxID=1911079 RepID=UPI003DA4E65D